MVIKYKVNDQGLYLSPGKEKSVNATEMRKRKKKQGDKYLSRKLTRLCPKCGAVITIKRNKVVRNDKLGIYRDTAAYICTHCCSAWTSKQTNKVWERLKVNPSKKISNAEFKKQLAAGGLPF